MKQKHNINVVTLIGSFLCLVLLISPACIGGFVLQEGKYREITRTSHTRAEGAVAEGTEYWGLLFAVGNYSNNPDQNRPEMIEACNYLYDVLMASSEWKSDHIHKVTGNMATGRNLIKELLWLKQNADNDDYVLVYITTHGSQLRKKNGQPLDLPPRDEADGADEILIMYDGFDKWYGFIWDDLLNFFLSLIKCKGLCLIVDSCYSGGFNDPPTNKMSPGKYDAESFVKGFVEDVAQQGRIVLMSCEETTLSYDCLFSECLIEGFAGLADEFLGNYDGINSAEESFNLALVFVELMTDGEQCPTMLDMYPGQFPVTSNSY